VASLFPLLIRNTGRKNSFVESLVLDTVFLPGNRSNIKIDQESGFLCPSPPDKKVYQAHPSQELSPSCRILKGMYREKGFLIK
jgi:hypothetical protein